MITNVNTSLLVTNAAGLVAHVYLYSSQDMDLTNITVPSFAYAVVGPLIQVTNIFAGYGVSPTRAVDIITTPVLPTFSPGPANQTNVAGTTASFTATVTGYGDIAYQWLSNNVPLANGGRISGATNTTLSISSVQLSDVANYALRASNFIGVSTSAVATLTVEVAPTSVTISGGDRTNLVNGSISFAVGSANGIPAPSYHWQLNSQFLSDDAHLTGSGAATMNISPLAPSDQGPYTVVASNLVGSVTSAPVSLVVIVPPAPIPLGAQLSGGNFVLSWTDPSFTLTSSTNVLGPYLAVPGATTGYSVGLTNPATFFKLDWHWP